jgi:hypothetical protein
MSESHIQITAAAEPPESEGPEQPAAADSRPSEEGCSPTPRIAAHFALSFIVWLWSWIVFFFQLLTFLQIRQPGKFMRAMVFLTQGLCQTTIFKQLQLTTTELHEIEGLGAAAVNCDEWTRRELRRLHSAHHFAHRFLCDRSLRFPFASF